MYFKINLDKSKRNLLGGQYFIHNILVFISSKNYEELWGAKSFHYCNKTEFINKFADKSFW